MGTTKSKISSAIDPISWLKSKDAESNFIKNVECVLNGSFVPIELHTKIHIIISGYLKNLNHQTHHGHIIPNVIEVLCVKFIECNIMSYHNNNSGTKIMQRRGWMETYNQLILKTNENNIIGGKSKLRIDLKSIPKDLILTVLGDYDKNIINKNKNASIILNVLGNFYGGLSCQYGGNIFVKCNNFNQSLGQETSIRNHSFVWNDDNLYKYGNILILTENNAELKWMQTISRNSFNSMTNTEIEKVNKSVIKELKRCKTLRIESNKNLFGNIYMNVGNELYLNDHNIDSGSIYIVCKKLKFENKNHIRAGRIGKNDIVVHTQHDFSFDGNTVNYHFYPDPVVYNHVH